MGKLIDGDNGLLDDEFDKSSDDQHSFGGAWTRIKLEALEKYLVAFNTALSKQSFTRLYIDAFAGTGRCDIKVDGEKMKSFQEAKQCLRGSVLETHIPMEGESPPVQASNDTSHGPSAENSQSPDETALGDEYRGPSLFAVMVRMGKVIARLAWDALRALPSTARNFIAKVRRISKKILGSLFRKKEEI